MSVLNQTPKRIHWLLIVFILVLALSGAFWKYRNQVAKFINDWRASKTTTEEKSGVTMDDQIFKSEFWQSLKSYGRLPILPSETGRANPFRPPSRFVDKPDIRDAKRVTDLITIASALSRYYSKEGHYPSGQAVELGVPAARCLIKSGWASEEVCEKMQLKYLDSVPRDPGAGQYLYTSNGPSYTLKIFRETAKGGPAFWEYTVPSKAP